MVVKVVWSLHSTQTADAALVTRLRTALAARPAPMKVFQLARALGAPSELVHRTLRRHPDQFEVTTGPDRVECWTLRSDGGNRDAAR